jgi:hypothetical protein
MKKKKEKPVSQTAFYRACQNVKLEDGIVELPSGISSDDVLNFLAQELGVGIYPNEEGCLAWLVDMENLAVFLQGGTPCYQVRRPDKRKIRGCSYVSNGMCLDYIAGVVIFNTPLDQNPTQLQYFARQEQAKLFKDQTRFTQQLSEFREVQLANSAPSDSY